MQSIYVVDDSTDQRLFLGSFLNRIVADYPARFLQGAPTLLDSLSDPINSGSVPARVIFLDFQLPEMNGYQAHKKIKQANQYKKSLCRDAQ
ncbi:response regulator [Dyadobacter psychrotolerans]|uniref:Response regulator n=1 Tax=Dyadobacter psychrotolerans TaxID=2541721 RepID=A0A4R5DBP6_9BACT|nr:response regulator [Dyadobacter psychrotolerans]TDE08984.1 response regulator [Dyadobacter psychrotolerans]